MSQKVTKQNQRKGASLRPDGKNLPATSSSRSPQQAPKKHALVMRGAIPTPVDDPAPEKRDWRKTAVGAALLCTAVALVGYALLMTPPPSKTAVKKAKQRESERIEQLVNKHLVMTNTKIEIEQRKKDLELRERLHHLGDTVHPRPMPSAPVGVDMSPDRHELNAINDLRGPSENLNYHNPQTEILREIADYQHKKAEEAAYNKAYRDAVIEEARRQGYELQFAPDGRILGAKPITNPGLRPGRGSASQ